MLPREQDFQNYLSLHDYKKAIHLALAMEQPGRLLSLFREVRLSSTDPESSTGHASVDEVIRTLCGSDLARLLRFARDWNANAKTSMIAQGIFFAVFKLRPAEHIMSAFFEEAGESAGISADPGRLNGVGGTALKELVDSLIPYTERHFSRIDRLVQESYMVDYILAEMDDGLIDIQSESDGMDID